MTVWSKQNLYDRIVDRWKERDGEYDRANRNRGIVTQYFRSDELIDTDRAGELLGQKIYNGSGPWYSRTLATGFQGALISKNIPWFRYMMEQFELKGIDQLDIWLQQVKDHMANAYQLSNFYDVQPQFTHDGVTTGSPLLFGEEDVLEKRTIWLPQHYNTVRIYYDKENRPEGVITMDKTWTAKKIVDEFIGDDTAKRKAKLNQSINHAYEQGLMNEKFTVYRATFKANDPVWDGEDFKKPNTDHLWLTAFFAELTDADGKKKDQPLNENMGDFTQPFSVWNFDKKPWDTTSSTPAFYALWDNLSLQQIDKNLGEDAQYRVRPAMVVKNSMGNRLQLGPEGILRVSDEEYDRPPKPIDRVGDLNISVELMDKKEDALKRWFMVDLFQMFSQLAIDKNQPVSAQQIWRMAGEKSTLLSPAVETHSRYLETIDERMVDIEARAGRGPFAPDVMENITDIVVSNLPNASKVGVRPVFIGQLAQAQKASQALEPITTSLEAIAPLVELFPDLPQLMIREYDTANDIFEALDFPQKNINPQEEYEEGKKALQQARAQQAQAELAIEAAKASKDVSGEVHENSILAGVTG